MPAVKALLLFIASLFIYLQPIKAEVITLASSQYYPHYAADLPQQGAVSELIRQAFLLQGVQIHIEFMPFARALRDSQQANYVGLIAAWYSDERAEHFYYSQPLYANYMVFFKRRAQSIHFTDYKDLVRQRLRLGLVQGYLPPQGLMQHQPAHINVATDEQAFKMLALGRVDLVPADKLNGQYLIAEKLPEYLGQLEALSPALELRPLYLLLSKQDPRAESLMQRFNSGQEELRRSGQYQQILQQLLPETVQH